ncbi:MAG: DNA mismatch repair endonuclease MutL [Deltaproteobacteria bacterium]|nr:DNA mismatch repair endonuclease MutL [Deltaproteobacteria bacterium]
MDEFLSSKIAAGEVVERPASVVKELVENSIDAGATEVLVYAAEAGKRLIRVVDNGSGMDRRDALICLERHATSKLLDEAGLSNIRTLGFRGEALSSIQAVARVTLRTKTRDAEAATVVKIEGGKVCSVTETAAPSGTSVEVRDLFYNTPARAKFLRAASSEFVRITEVIKRIALSCPHVKFVLTHGSLRVIDTRPGTVRQRVLDIFGQRSADGLIELTSEDTVVSGYISKPEASLSTHKGLFVYLNNRWIRDFGLTRSICAGYGGLLPEGRYPFAVVFITMPPDEADVNVHPAKYEVRFKSPSLVYDIVKARVRDALAKVGPRVAADVPYIADLPRGLAVAEAGVGWNAEGTSNNRAHGLNLMEFYCEPAPNPVFLDMDVAGQLWGEYMVCTVRSSNEVFFIIDQHAAHERVRFEALKRSYLNGQVPTQFLLVPLHMETTAEEKDVLLSSFAMLGRLGFDIMEFGPSAKRGGETFLIRGVPDMLATAGGFSSLIIEIAETISSEIDISRVEGRFERILMSMACHSVIRGPKLLAREESLALLKDLSKVDFSSYCPHGRPIFKRYTRKELETALARQ